MTLRLPFNWQKTRFSMYCIELVSVDRMVVSVKEPGFNLPSSIPAELEASWASW